VKTAIRTPHTGTLLPRPTPGQISTTLVAVAVGGLMLMIPGAVLGLCLGIILWTADAIQDV
jgi:hypothetical protein